ncbi:MAG: hypothetical protein ACI84O_001366 [Myxococcota bacterium]|jgi:hypothetical protein
MSQNKTQKTKASVAQYLNAIEDKQQRADAKAIDKMMKLATGCKGVMWSESLVGYQDVHLKYASGRELDWFKVGFSPRKGKLSLYVSCSAPETEKLLTKLGKQKRGKSCLYINKLADVDAAVLQQVIEVAVKHEGTC